MRLAFLGTPDFAVPSLEALAASSHQVQLVVSQPDKARGRGRAPLPTPVRRRARELGLEETTLEKGGRKALYERILRLDVDVVVVVAFGHIIREPLLHGPRHGCVNLHASLLPRWRGPAPIHRAIVAGDERTGVCTMQLEAGVDTGPVYRCVPTAIGPDETAGELHDRLAIIGAGLLVETLDAIENEGLRPRPQDEEGACAAPRLDKSEGTVDFARPAAEVHDRIRGLTPWPGITVRSSLGPLRLAGSRRTDEPAAGAPGEVLSLDERGMLVACGEGAIRIERVQAPGTRWMSPVEFARGHALQPRERLEAVGEVPPRRTLP